MISCDVSIVQEYRPKELAQMYVLVNAYQFL